MEENNPQFNNDNNRNQNIVENNHVSIKYDSEIISLSNIIDNESIKCRKIISDLFEKLGLSKNQHKKNTIKYIRWRT